MESNGHKLLGPCCSRERAVGGPSTCLIQKEGGASHLDKALSSTFPFLRLALCQTLGAHGCAKDGGRALLSCQVNCTYRQNLRKLTNCSIESAIHSANEESKLSFSQTNLTAKSAGTFVNRHSIQQYQCCLIWEGLTCNKGGKFS